MQKAFANTSDALFDPRFTSINGTKDIDLRMRRIKANKRYEFSAFAGLCLDSAVRVVNKKYNTYKEDNCKEESTYESFKFVDDPYKNVYI